MTTDRKPPFKKDDLENEDSVKEEGLEKWQVGLIIGAVAFSIFLVTVLVMFGINHGSRKRAKYRTRNQLHRPNFDEVIANNYA